MLSSWGGIDVRSCTESVSWQDCLLFIIFLGQEAYWSSFLLFGLFSKELGRTMIDIHLVVIAVKSVSAQRISGVAIHFLVNLLFSILVVLEGILGKGCSIVAAEAISVVIFVVFVMRTTSIIKSFRFLVDQLWCSLVDVRSTILI